MKKLLFIFLVFNLTFLNVFSQSGWFMLNSGSGGTLYDIFFLNDNTGYVSGEHGTILKTSNGGFSWTDISIEGTDRFYNVYFINQQTGFVCSQNYILKTTTAGSNWSISINNTQYYTDVSFLNENTGIAIANNQIFKTTDSGNIWLLLNSGNYYTDVNCFNNPETYYVKESGGTPWVNRVMKSTNQGLNWFQCYAIPTNNGFGKIFFINFLTGFITYANWSPFQYIFVRTTNGGANWSGVNLESNLDYKGLYFINSNTGYLTADYGKIFKTTNGGINFINQTEGIGGVGLNAITFSSINTGYAAGPNGVIKKTTNGGEPIGIQPISNEIPSSFKLFQNYPNPFNPITKIKFDIPKISDVKIKIYDILGREVTILVNEKLNAGTFEREWNAADFSSGVYFYKVEAESFSEVKKMVVVK